MLNPIQVEYNLQSAEYYFATLMDQLVDETMQLEPIDCGFTEQVNQLFYTIEAVRFLVDRGIFTENPTCLAVYNLMMTQIGINTTLPNLTVDNSLVIPGQVPAPSLSGYLPLSGGTMTGQLNASAGFTNNISEIGGSGVTYNISLIDYFIYFTGTAASNAVLPIAETCKGMTLIFKNISPNNSPLTVSAQSGDVIIVSGTTSVSSFDFYSGGGGYQLISNGLNWIIYQN